MISTRVDLFPEQYTSKLASLQDDLDPMPAEQVKAVVVRELLQGEPLETIFRSFDDEPLGSASIAQVDGLARNGARQSSSRIVLTFRAHTHSPPTPTPGPRRHPARRPSGS